MILPGRDIGEGQRFRAHHAFLLQQILTKIDFLDETVARVTEEIDRRLAPFETRWRPSTRFLVSIGSARSASWPKRVRI
jgi:hypothetical protein